MADINSLVPAYVNEYLSNFIDSAPTLLLFTSMIAVYSVAIYVFYVFVAKRDTFGFDIERYKKHRAVKLRHRVYNELLAILKYGLVYPMFVFLWFAGFSLLLLTMSKGQTTEELLVISITIVSAVRIVSYIRESLATELAKLLPLTLLAIFVTEPEFFSFGIVKQRLYDLPEFIPKIVGFMAFSIVLEWLLRILFRIRVHLFGFPGESKEDLT